MTAQAVARDEVRGGRLGSIDIMRGLVMILMTMDHVRGNFTFAAQHLKGAAAPLPYDPTDLAVTTPALFLMRWVTHLCAPVFIFLAGVGVHLWEQRHGERRSVSRYLAVRGFMLIVVNLLLNMHMPLSAERFVVFDVLWPIGVSMVLLAGAVHLPSPLAWCMSLLLTAGHDAVRGFMPTGEAASVLWRVGFVNSWIDVPGVGRIDALYPVLPWFGLMLLGYLCGGLFRMAPAERRRVLLALAGGCIALFILLRVTGWYGDPHDMAVYGATWQTVASFFIIAKYPPSLQFMLITLGVMFALLALVEASGGHWRFVSVLGKVPLVYYVLHILVIRGLTALLLRVDGHGASPLTAWAFSVPGVLLSTIAVLVALYPVCAFMLRMRASAAQVPGKSEPLSERKVSTS